MDLDFDIFKVEDSMIVWLDVMPVITQTLMEDLFAGLSLRFDIRVRIEHPPNPVFAKTRIQKNIIIQVSRDLTHDNYSLLIIHSRIDSLLFRTQVDMSEFLTDSIEINLGSIRTIDKDEKLRANIEIYTKSFASKGADQPGQVDRGKPAGSIEDESDVIETLFSHFLEIIGFGKRSYRVISPTFTIQNLDSFPSQN
ncbi:MAG: hypothetical protein KAR42_14650 [candidate division Zixibacteria bacterium]|nr:hypothetical protein [candidate division Zixibacteria bacterium]